MTTTDMTPAATETFAPVAVTIDDGPLTPDTTGTRGWRACIVVNPETRTVTISAIIGSGTPANVWHNRALALSVGALASGKHLRDLLEGDDAQALLADLCDQYEGTRWDGHNNVGTWACDDETGLPDYTVPVATLEQMIEGVPSYWSAADWISGAYSECKREVEKAILSAKDESAEAAALDALANEWIAADGDAILDRADVRKQIDAIVDDLAEGGEEEVYVVEGAEVNALEDCDLDAVLADIANLGETWVVVEATTEVGAARKARTLRAQGGAACVAEVRNLAAEWTYPGDALDRIVSALPA